MGNTERHDEPHNGGSCRVPLCTVSDLCHQWQSRGWVASLQLRSIFTYYSSLSYAMIQVHLHKLVTIIELKKTVKDTERMVPEQMIQDEMGNIHKKCKACKQAEGDHFVSFLLYLKKQFWIFFQVLVSFFFYELYLSSYALILGVSREKSYCRIRRRPLFMDFDENVTDQWTNGPTDGRTRPLIEMRGRI